MTDLSKTKLTRIQGLSDSLSELTSAISSINNQLTTLSSNLTALDNNAVHKTGNENISGAKFFSSTIFSTRDYRLLERRGRDNKTVATLETKDVENNNALYLFCFSDNGDQNANLSLFYNNGNPSAILNNFVIPAGDNSNKIATTEWCYDYTKSTNLVHRTGNEDISGTKKFLENLLLSVPNNDKLILIDPRVDCSSDTGTDTFNTIIFRDGANNNYANVAVQNMADGGNRLRLWVSNKKSDGTSVSEQLWIKALKDGSFQTYAPHCTNGNSILTTKEISTGNNYALLGNGLIFQWGSELTSSTDHEVVLRKPFTTKSYFATCLDTSSGFNYAISDHSTTSFHIKSTSSGRNVRWFAVGF